MKKAILDKIESDGVEPNVAMGRFYDWINNHPAEMLGMTDTAGYDIGFLNYYLSKANLPSMNYIIGNSYKPTRDSSSFHMGVGKQTPDMGLWGAESAALKALGATMPENPYKADHNPVNDAKSICWEIMQIHNFIKNKK